MAVGKTNTQRTSKSYDAQITVKEGQIFIDDPYFTFTKKIDGEYKYLTLAQTKEAFGVEGFIRDVSGDLVSISTRPGVYQDKPIHNVTLELVDPAVDETIYVKYTIGSDYGRKLTNTILNLKTFENVKIGVWGQRSKKNDKSYPTVSVRQGTVKDTIKYLLDPRTAPELQPREYIGEGEKTKRDYTKVDAFLFAKITEFGAALAGAPRSPVVPPAHEEAPSEPAAVGQDDESSELPF